MSAYDAVKVGKLVLKGEKDKTLARKRKKNKKEKREEFAKKTRKIPVDEDAIKHGGWWVINTISQITGHVAIQFGDHYVKALSNGLFTLGECHAHNAGPDPEEIFTAFVSNNETVAFKSGYGKYIKAENNNTITGCSEAVGNMEQWKPVFTNGKMALLSALESFMSANPEKETNITLSKSLTDSEILQIRSSADRENTVDSTDVDNKSNLSVVELNYVKMFQKFQDKKLRINTNDVKELEIAKNKGNLHEVLLDRRSEMKADRYCK